MSFPKKEEAKLDIAILGTRGIPARYGGFETLAEELSTRLACRGHRVTVYGRTPYVNPRLALYRGVRIITVPCLHSKYLETVSHTAVSVLCAIFRRHQVVLICNSANAFVCGLVRLGGSRVALNVDGIERQRKKWSLIGRAYYRFSEFLATQLPDAVVTDAECIRDYYLEEFGLRTRVIVYGAPAGRLESRAQLEELGLQSGEYILYVSRLEPENNAHLVIEAHRWSGVSLPLVLVGDAPYGARYKRRLEALSKSGRVLMPGAIYGTGYRELQSHCRCFVQATEVGGTHPALIEAMGAGCIVLANDTPEHREVVADTALIYPFNDARALGRLLRQVCGNPEGFAHLGHRAAERVAERYRWQEVVERYEDLFRELSN